MTFSDAVSSYKQQKQWQAELEALSDEARLLLEWMRRGYRLRVEKHGQAATLEKPQSFPDRQTPTPPSGIWVSAAAEVKKSKFVFQLTREGNPPASERKPHEGWRYGWEELGLDGEKYEWWVLMQ
jgi:hypothetical protein